MACSRGTSKGITYSTNNSCHLGRGLKLLYFCYLFKVIRSISNAFQLLEFQFHFYSCIYTLFIKSCLCAFQHTIYDNWRNQVQRFSKVNDTTRSVLSQIRDYITNWRTNLNLALGCEKAPNQTMNCPLTVY